MVAACSSAYKPAAPDDAGADAAALSDSGAVSSDASGTNGDANASDPNDSGAAACTKTADGAPCTDSAACCSGACGNNKTCVSACLPSDHHCGGSVPCCVDHYCSYNNGGSCRMCHGTGDYAEVLITTGAVDATSCCSGKVDLVTNECVE